jgi:two-component system response regulator HydG
MVAETIAQGGIRYATERGDPSQVGQWLKAFSTTLYHQGKVEESAQALEIAVEVQPDAEERASTFVLIACRRAFLLGQTSALENIGRAQEISGSYPQNFRLTAEIHMGRALVLERIDEVEDSLAHSQQASRLLLNVQNCLFRAANALNNQALCLADHGRPKEGLARVVEALSLAKRDGRSHSVAGITESVGYILLLTGEYAKAEELLRESERLLTLHNYRLELVSSLISLSMLYERTHKWKAARTEAEKAVQLAESLNLQHLICKTRLQLESVLANTPKVVGQPLVFHGIIHISSRMKHAISLIKKVAPVDAPVLITGETGTGKELVAKAIHEESKRKSKPFVPFNCSALSRELAESRLFGHRRGAFTGADRDQSGVIRAANGGTIFLDEIGDLSLEAQAILLRFLQSGEVQPLGYNAPISSDVRVVAATNRDLRLEAEAGRFRKDLYYRLNVTSVTLPPLWARKDDIPLLARHFAKSFSKECDRTPLELDDAEIARLLDYDWPGNVRELENYIKRRVLFGQVEVLRSPAEGAGGGASHFRAIRNSLVETADLVWRLLDETEKWRVLSDTLAQTNGNVTQAARQLGISRRTIQRVRRQKKIPPA